jgi:hypothetical protein
MVNDIPPFSDVLAMAKKKIEPQRLLFVFAKTEDNNPQSPLLPVMYIERTLDEVPDFAAIQKEANASGQDWQYVFVAGLLGKDGQLPSVEEAELQMEGMVAAIQKRALENMFSYDRDGEPVEFLVFH